jgi:hypothetical protein
VNRKRSIRMSAGGLAFALATLVACAGPALRDASAQGSSATRTQTSGSMIAAGGSSISATRAIVGETGGTPGSGRGSSATRDVVPGITGGAFSSQVTTVVTTPAGGYVGVAFPVSATTSTVGGILDELGAYDNTKWRFGRWSPADSAYMEPGTSLALTTVAVGQGYWLITKDAASVAATGLPAPAAPYRVPLVTHPGTPTRAAWNQVGNPFLFPVDVSKLQVTDGMSTFFITDVANTLTDPVVKGWGGGGYADMTVLNGRSSYWVRTKQGTSTVTLIFPYQGSASGSPAPAMAKPPGADWAVALVAKQGELQGEPVMMGASSLAPGPRGNLNHVAAPLPPGGAFVSLRIPRQDWGDGYVSEFQPQAERMTWDVLAQGAEVPGEITLELKAFDVPSGARFWLTDHATGTTQEIAPGGTVTIAATATPRPLRLEAVAAGAVGPAPTIVDDALRYAYPNPFGASTGFAFALARGGDIRVDIYDVAGRNVRQLARAAQGPGEYVLVWDGRDAGGKSLRSGVYLARYHAGTASGVRRLIRVE